MKASRLGRELFVQLLTELEKTGVTPDELFCELQQRGLDISNISNHEIAGPESLVVLETALELSADPTFALRLGQTSGIESFGTFGFALMSCANLRASLQLILRYGQAVFQWSYTAHEHEGGLLLRANPILGSAESRRLVTELSFSNLSKAARSLYGSQVVGAEGVELHLNYSKPQHAAFYRSVFGAPVVFDCEHSQMVIPAHLLDAPVKTANRTEHVVFRQQCEEMLRGLNSVERTTAAVREVLMQSAGDFLDIGQVAEHLHISERTLRRRLDDEGTSFRTTFDEVRDHLACEYLLETELTVAEIAHLLDYSETVNFRRAFLRWNGLTPSDFREQYAKA